MKRLGLMMIPSSSISSSPPLSGRSRVNVCSRCNKRGQLTKGDGLCRDYVEEEVKENEAVEDQIMEDEEAKGVEFDDEINTGSVERKGGKFVLIFVQELK
jgi:hypothetical protein